jgi:tetratricopeptide (TPR) repeat protein
MAPDNTRVDPRGKGDDLPALPRLESTYTQIIGRAISAAKVRTGLTQRLRSATRELMALVPHTKTRFSMLSVMGKVAVVVILLAIGSGSTLLAGRLFGSGSPEGLRQRVRQALGSQEYVEAKRLLHLLAASSDGLSAVDRFQLLAPTQAGLDRMQRELQKQAQDHAAAGHFDEALAVLDSMDKAALAPEWVAFTRGEILRSARRHAESIVAYKNFLDMAPESDRADDALFWQASAHKELGQNAEAKKTIETLLERHPNTNFKSSAKRWLTELETQ